MNIVQNNKSIECRATRTPDKFKGSIGCLGRVSIPSWPVTPALSPISNLNISTQIQCIQSSPQSKSVSHPGNKKKPTLKINSRIRYMEQFTVTIRPTRTPGNIRGRIRCFGGLSILYCPVTSAVSPLSKLGVRDYPSSKPVWKWQSNWEYETRTPFSILASDYL
jgi:hypothetical protein